MKMKALFLSLQILALAGMSVQAANPGSCFEDAIALASPGSSEGSVSVSLTPEFDKSSQGYRTKGVCYFAVNLTKGANYTFWVTGNSPAVSMRVIANIADMSSPMSPFQRYTVNGQEYCTIRSSEWLSIDPATCRYYVKFEAYQTGFAAGTLHYIQGEKVPRGTETDPWPLTMGSEYKTVSAALLTGGNKYYFKVALTKGSTYQFETLFGNEKFSTGVNAAPIGGSSAADRVVPYKKGDYDSGITITAGTTGNYLISVTGPASDIPGWAMGITLGYGPVSMKLRTPEEHDPIALPVGARKTCKPGYQCVPNSGFDDTIVDERLFRLDVEKGRRYVVETDGADAASPLMAILYGSAGSDILGVTEPCDGVANLCLGFEATEALHYVGVCENLSGSKTPAYREIGVTLAEVGADPHADDVTVLRPPLTAGATTSPVSVDQSEQAAHRLTREHWQDLYAFFGQQGFAYRLRAVTEAQTPSAPGLVAEVFYIANGSTNAVSTTGSVSPEVAASNYLEFTAANSGTYLVRVRSAAGCGVAYPNYRLRACAYSTSANSMGTITVSCKGPSAEDRPGWTLDGVAYPLETGIFAAAGTRTVAFGAVSGMRTPDPTNVTLAAKASVSLVGVYDDLADHGDDVMSGATELSVGTERTSTSSHSLWAETDPADWFAFNAVVGRYYEFALEDLVGDPIIVIFGPDGQATSYLGTRVAFPPTVGGRHYVQVIHALDQQKDSSYRLTSRYVEVGAVAFTSAAVTCGETAGKVDLQVKRSTKSGVASVRWGTIANTARAGTDYHAAQGTVVFADGQDTATISVEIIPDAIPVKRGNRSFSVRLEPVLDLPDGEYPMPVADPSVATVTITDEGEPPVIPVIRPTDAPDVESAATDLTTGSFFGVLREDGGFFDVDSVNDLADLAVESSGSAGMTATVKLADGVRQFKLESLTSAEETTSAVLTNGNGSVLLLKLPEGTAGDLGTGVPRIGSAELWLNYESVPGVFADIVVYTGPLFRADNAKHKSVRERLVPAVGRHTVALADADSGSSGCGYLSFDLAVDGTVSGVGRMADGWQVALSGSAAVVEEYGETVVKVPFRCLAGERLFGGVLSLIESDGVMAVRFWEGEDELVWNDDSKTDAFGGSLKRELRPFGGKYDLYSNLAGLFAGSDLMTLDGEKPVSISNTALKTADGSLNLSLDRATGVLTDAAGANRGIVLLSGATDDVRDFVAAGATGDGEAGFRIVAVPTSRDESEDWGFVSTLRFDGNGADAGVPADITAEAGSAIELPMPDLSVFKRTGYLFAGWQTHAGFFPGGATCPMPAADATAVAVWALDVEKSLKGPGLENLIFTCSNVEWKVCVTNGETLLQSGAVAKGGKSILIAKSLASGTVTFTWKCFTDVKGYAGCEFAVNGVKKAEICDKMKDWADSAEYDVEAGDELSWTFWRGKDAYDVAPDCAWLERVSFGRKTTVTFSAESTQGEVWTTNVTGYAGTDTLGDHLDAMPKAVWATEMVTDWETEDGDPVTLDWAFPDEDATLVPAAVVPRKFFLLYDANGGEGAVPVDAGHAAGEFAKVASGEGLSREGYAFAGWLIEGDVYQAGEEYKFDASDVPAVAQWTLDVAAALGPGAKAFVFETSGNAEWSPDGKSMGSGAIGKGQKSVLTATATKSGELTFEWTADCDEVKYAWCAFAVNGVEKGRIGDQMKGDWKMVPVDVKAGDVLTWTYQKTSGAYAIGEDRAWVRDFKFGLKVEVSFEPGDDCETDLKPVMMYAGGIFGEGANKLPSDADGTAVWTNHSLKHWFLKGDEWEEDVAGTPIPDHAVTLVAKLIEKQRYVRFYDEDGVTVIHEPISGVAGATVKLPETNEVPKKAGYALAGWRSASQVYAPGTDFPLPAADTDMTAMWALDGLDAVLGEGAKAFAFGTSGDAEWSPDGQSMGSGKIANGRKSVLTATAKSSGELTFEWTSDCDEVKYAWCAFAVNGVEKGRIGDRMKGVWKAVTVDVKAGDVLMWTYQKASDAYAIGEDRAWVRDFKFGVKTTVTFRAESTQGEVWTTNVTGYAGTDTLGDHLDAMPKAVWATEMVTDWETEDGDPVTLDWAFPDEDATLVPAAVVPRKFFLLYDANGGEGAVPVDAGHAAGDFAKVASGEGLAREGYAFAGWLIDGALYLADEEYEFRASDVPAVAQWTLDVKSALKGPGLENLAFTRRGPEWGADTVEGEPVMRSGAVAKGGEKSVLSATALASGSVTFTWKCFTDEKGYAGCEFAVNGVKKAEICDKMKDWADSAEIAVAAGDELTWTFWRGKDAYDVAPDCAWLERVSFGRKTTVTFSAESTQGERWTTNVTGFAGTETLGDYLDAMPKAVWATEMVTDWETEGGDPVTLDWAFPDEDATLVPAAVVPRKFFLLYDANGGEGAVPVDAGHAAGEFARVASGEGLARKGYAFAGWLIDGTLYLADEEYEFRASDVPAVAQWTLDVKSALKGPGLENLAFTRRGPEWGADTVEGEPVMRSGAVAKGGEKSVLSATALASGSVTFTWKCFTDEKGYAGCEFAVNGVKKAEICDKMKDWADSAEYDVEAGDVLTWTFWRGKDAYNVAPDCAWLERVSFGPRMCTVRFLDTDRQTELCAAVTREAGETIALPTGEDVSVKKPGCSLKGWTDGETTFDPGEECKLVISVDLVAVWALDKMDEILGPGAAAFDFTTGEDGNPGWEPGLAEDEKTCSGYVQAMKSGTIGKGASSVLTATAKSSGVVSFDWKCFTDEKGYAGCKFAINGVVQDEICDKMSSWKTSAEFDVAEGDVLTWTFWRHKDAYNVDPDCAWISMLNFSDNDK